MEQFMMMMMLHLVTNVTFGYNSIDEVRKDDEMGIYDSGMKMQNVCLKSSKYALPALCTLLHMPYIAPYCLYVLRVPESHLKQITGSGN